MESTQTTETNAGTPEMSLPEILDYCAENGYNLLVPAPEVETAKGTLILPQGFAADTRAARRLRHSRENIHRLIEAECQNGSATEGQQWERFAALLLRIESDALAPSHEAELEGRHEDAKRLMSEGLARVRRHWEDVLQEFDLAF